MIVTIAIYRERTALLIPVAEHNALGDSSVAKVESVMRGPMRVAMDQFCNGVRHHRRAHSRVIHIGNRVIDRSRIALALRARLGGETLAF